MYFCVREVKREKWILEIVMAHLTNIYKDLSDLGDSNGYNMILALRKPTIQLVTKTCKQLAIKDN